MNDCLKAVLEAAAVFILTFGLLVLAGFSPAGALIRQTLFQFLPSNSNLKVIRF
jgi:hypothetical protein